MPVRRADPFTLSLIRGLPAAQVAAAPERVAATEVTDEDPIQAMLAGIAEAEPDRMGMGQSIGLALSDALSGLAAGLNPQIRQQNFTRQATERRNRMHAIKQRQALEGARISQAEEASKRTERIEREKMDMQNLQFMKQLGFREDELKKTLELRDRLSKRENMTREQISAADNEARIEVANIAARARKEQWQAELALREAVEGKKISTEMLAFTQQFIQGFGAMKNELESNGIDDPDRQRQYLANRISTLPDEVQASIMAAWQSMYGVEADIEANAPWLQGFFNWRYWRDNLIGAAGLASPGLRDVLGIGALTAAGNMNDPMVQEALSAGRMAAGSAARVGGQMMRDAAGRLIEAAPSLMQRFGAGLSRIGGVGTPPPVTPEEAAEMERRLLDVENP